MPDGGKYYMLKNKAKTGTRMLVWKTFVAFNRAVSANEFPVEVSQDLYPLMEHPPGTPNGTCNSKQKLGA